MQGGTLDKGALCGPRFAPFPSQQGSREALTGEREAGRDAGSDGSRGSIAR